MPGLLNLGSLVLGLVAWILPVVNLVQHNKANNRSWIVMCMASISACAISLCMQIFYTNHLVKIEDWSALMDTSSAVTLVATVLLIITILLNTVAFIVYYKKKQRTDKQEFDDDFVRWLIQTIQVIDVRKEEMPYGTFV